MVLRASVFSADTYSSLSWEAMKVVLEKRVGVAHEASECNFQVTFKGRDCEDSVWGGIRPP
jgi:hypothetical protein